MTSLTRDVLLSDRYPSSILMNLLMVNICRRVYEKVWVEGYGNGANVRDQFDLLTNQK